MALPLTGFDLICLAVPSECLFGELYLISLTCGMVFLKARVALFDIVEKHLPTVHCYANDSQLYISFSPKAHSGQADAVALVSLKATQGIYRRSNDGKLLNIPSCKSLSMLGYPSFYMAAPKLWNDLPFFY